MRGMVVEHKNSGVRYAISEKNFNEKIHKRVRDLRPGETVLGFKPKPKQDLGTPTKKTEGSSPEDAKGTK